MVRHYQNIISSFKYFQKGFLVRPESIIIREALVLPSPSFQSLHPCLLNFLVHYTASCKLPPERQGGAGAPTAQQSDHTKSATVCCRGEYKKNHRFPKTKTPTPGE